MAIISSITSCTHYKKVKLIGVLYELWHVYLLWIAASIYLNASFGLTYGCKNEEACSTMDGSCPVGCDPGWYGPCCKVGNLAFIRPTNQSSTYENYTSNYAVNGIVPDLGDTSENNCSHTAELPNSVHWWYVTLSDSEDFVLKNVTIVRRQTKDDPMYSIEILQDFYILYTTNNTGNPDPSNWKVFKYESYHQSSIVKAYTCSNTAIGRRVAIYLSDRPRINKKLVLCEVYVDGYSYTDVIIQQDLRITQVPLSNNVTVELTRLPAVPFNFLVLFLNSTQDEKGIPFPVQAKNRHLFVNMPLNSNKSYAISVAPETCCFNDVCLKYDVDDDHTTTDHKNCVIGKSTPPVIVVPVQQSDSSTPTTSDSLKETIAASVGGAIAFIAIVIISIIMLTRRKTKNVKKKTETGQATIGKTAVHINDAYIDEEDPIYDNTLGMDIAEFEIYSRNESSILDKFAELRVNKGQVHEQALLHKKKNRFKDIVPYDFNRVILQHALHDYINASYINGFKRKNKYIATQGPTSCTIADFWNMVWQEDVTVIVMLTPYVEDSKKKCKPYFPIKDRNKYGFLVDLQSENAFDTHNVSILNVNFKEESKTVYHLHFLAWPDRSVPEHSGDLIVFLAKVRKTVYAQCSRRGPIVVHCSAGVGRTGAYIALDYMLDRYLAERRVDMDSCVVGLRDQRMHMVQTKEQYAFIHTALLYGMKTLGFVRDVEDLSNLSENCGVHNDYRLAAEWKCLQESNDGPKYPSSYYATALLPENKLKNRHPEILASEEKRPILGGLNGSSQTYINAVFCNGCYSKNDFIATQWPMNETISDFWELVHDCSPGCIILLHHSPSPQEYPVFVPSPGTRITAGAFTVKSLSSSRNQETGISEQELSVRLTTNRVGPKSSPLTVRLVELGLFALDDQIPPDFPQTARLIEHLLPLCKQSSHQHPIIVVCKDGATYCGLFLAAANSLHRMIESGYVQVFHTVDLLRASRAQFVSTQAQYNYLYQLLKYYNGTKSAPENR